jgi:hypothetical protein
MYGTNANPVYSTPVRMLCVLESLSHGSRHTYFSKANKNSKQETTDHKRTRRRKSQITPLHYCTFTYTYIYTLHYIHPFHYDSIAIYSISNG